MLDLPNGADRARLIAAMLRSDLYSFIQAVFPLVTGGERLSPNWHLDAIADALTGVLRGDTRRLIITMPPRSLKSIAASVAFPAFVLGQDPSRKIIAVSYADGLAKKHANDCRAVMRSPLYQAAFPKTRISPAKDTETEIMTTARGSRLTTSVGGILTGRGASLIIIDDPLKPQDAMSESAREHVKHWYSNTLLSRLDQKANGAIIVVMQRLHPDDLVGHLLEQGGWTHLNLPAIAEENQAIRLSAGRIHYRKIGDILHPTWESRAILDAVQRDMGSMTFAAQYQQSPVATEGNLIKWSWFKFYDTEPTPQPGDRLIVTWDTAMTNTELADYSACIVMLVRKGMVYILDVIRARLEYPDLRRAVYETHRTWRSFVPDYSLIIEKKGSGLSLLQDLHRERIYAIPILPEGDKILRMHEQTAPIEAGAVHLPIRARWLEEFKKELLAFPVGKHDDQVDALSQGLRRAFTRSAAVARGGLQVRGRRD